MIKKMLEILQYINKILLILHFKNKYQKRGVEYYFNINLGSEEDIVDGEADSANLDDFLNNDGEHYYDLNTTPIITRNVEHLFTENDR